MNKILVVKGGTSPEREVSLRSGSAVYKALLKAGFPAEEYDFNGNEHELSEKISSSDIVFPILHGAGGEDGYIQTIIGSQGKRFLGTGALESQATFNKKTTHQKLEAVVTMPKYEIVNDTGSILFSNPFVLKPIDGGSSIDTIICRQASSSLFTNAQELITKHGQMIVEELVEGIELTVPILGDTALPVILIKPPDGEEFDYANKYNGRSSEICPIADDLVSQDDQKSAQEIALKVHKELGAKHLSRVDIILDSNGNFFVLEINTMPGMTDASLYPLSAKTAGYDMPKLMQKFVELIEHDA